jgi:hypothetical protein
MPITRAELRELATVGMRERVRRLEQHLAAIWKDFPDLFLGDAPPQLLRPERREAGDNGHMPAVRITPPRKMSQWTPARRAAQSRRMKAIRNKLTRARLAAMKKRGGRYTRLRRVKLGAHQQIHAFLTDHPGSTNATLAHAASIPLTNMASILRTGIRRGWVTRKNGVYYAATEPSA